MKQRSPVHHNGSPRNTSDHWRRVPMVGLLLSLAMLFVTLHLYLLLQQYARRSTTERSSSSSEMFFLKTNNAIGNTPKKSNTRTATKHREETLQRESSSTTSANDKWTSVNILDFGAVGDNVTDNTAAIRNAIRAVAIVGGEIVIPEGGVFQTGPFNLTSNIVLRVDGMLFGIPDQDVFPVIGLLPTYPLDYDLKGMARFQPLVNAVDQDNITIRGPGTIDGAGWYWYPCFRNHTLCKTIGRPHLVELQNCTNVEITGVTLKDSAFWTLHPVYCTNVHIHHMRIEAPHCRLYRCPNTDGIDVDSCQNVLIEHNIINVGDDHVTVIAGRKRTGPKVICRNVTVRHNTLLNGMGLSIGSGTAGGVEDVVFYGNTMNETYGQRGQGLHIKTRTRFGGFVRRIAWIDNVFYVAGKPGGAISIEQGYQSGKATCDPNKCTDISNVVIRNLTVHEGNPGYMKCFENKPCVNITLDNVRFLHPPRKEKIDCTNVLSGSVTNLFPENILDGCPSMVRGHIAADPWDYSKMIKG